MSTTTSSERTKLGYGLREEEGEDFWLFGALTTIKISAEDTAGRYCVIDTEVPPGVGSPWHVHRDEDEWFFVHEGECEVYIGDAHLTLTAGGFAFGPKGVPHTFFGGPNGGKMLIWAEGGSSRGSSERSLSLPPSTLCHRRLKVHRTWSYSCPSRKSGRTTSSGPRVHPPGAESVTRTSAAVPKWRADDAIYLRIERCAWWGIGTTTTESFIARLPLKDSTLAQPAVIPPEP